MLYEKRTVKCAATGITRQQAHESLTSSEDFVAGTEVLELKRRGNQWVATLLEPKHAEFPPPKDDDNEEKTDSDESPSKDESGSEGDDAPKGEGPPKPEGPKGGEKSELNAVLDILMAVADKLGVGPGAAAPGAEDNPMPGDGPPPPPSPAPPGGGLGGPGHQEVVHRTKLKPGDTPPGVTPVGSPAFASVQEQQLSRMASFDAFDDTPGKSIKQAKAELEAMYGPHGFTVRQIKRVEGGKRLAAKLSRR